MSAVGRRVLEAVSARARPGRRTTWRRLPRIWPYDLALALCAAGAWAAFVGHGSPPLAGYVAVPWWAVALLFFAAEWWAVDVSARQRAHSVSLNEVAIVVGLYALAPERLLLAQLVGSVVPLVVRRRQTPVKLVFNLAQFMLTTTVALLVFHGLARLGDPFGPVGWLATLAAVAASSLLGIVLVTLAIQFAEGAWMIRRLFWGAVAAFAVSATASCIALVAVELLRAEARDVALLAAPVLLVALGFHEVARQHKRHEHLEFLYESMKETQRAPGLSAALGRLLAAMRHLAQAEYAEIVLLPSAGETGLRSTLAAGGGVVHGELSGDEERILEQLRADEVLLLPERRAPGPLDDSLRARGLPDAMITSLRGDDGPFGLLVVGSRASDVESFDADSARLLETFAGHAGVLLENGRLERSLADVTQLKERLRHQAFHDDLTGLPNRALFAERIATLLAAPAEAAASLSVLFIDLDDFKAINDSGGHTVGDELLVQVAARVRDCVRPEDLPARLGGDEFGVLLAATTRDEAEAVARRLVEAFAEPFTLGGRETYVHASVGIALAADACDTDELLRNADIAMYAAKAAGKKRFAHYESSMHERVRTRHDFVVDLEQAAARDEITVVFQPIVTLADGSVRAFEALARWTHPERGVVLPEVFIPVAEEAGLMEAIGADVLRQACRAAAEWRAQPGGAGVGVTVNISPSQLASRAFADEVTGALREAGIPGECLTLEITESATMHDVRFVVERLHELRALGVTLALDDFGTGHSSLERLDVLPLDVVKVAKPFLDRLCGPQATTSFVDAFVRLAQSLGISCVAEGIEHESQVAQLLEVGYSLGQGFFFARPMPRTEIDAFLDARRGVEAAA